MLGDSVSIHCHASGHPKPVITWSKRNPDNTVGNFIDIQKTTNEYRYVQLFLFGLKISNEIISIKIPIQNEFALRSYY